jgi:hypothetical protein
VLLVAATAAPAAAAAWGIVADGHEHVNGPWWWWMIYWQHGVQVCVTAYRQQLRLTNMCTMLRLVLVLRLLVQSLLQPVCWQWWMPLLPLPSVAWECSAPILY